MPPILRLMSIVFLLCSTTAVSIDLFPTFLKDQQGTVNDAISRPVTDSLSDNRIINSANDDTGNNGNPTISSTEQINRRRHLDNLVSQFDFLSIHRMIKPRLKNVSSLDLAESNDRLSLLDDLKI